MSGPHDPARGGFSLTIGARAQLKRTYIFSERTWIEYHPYYAGGSYHGHKNPAELFNIWCSFTLGESPQEKPYSDEAALFFHRFMLSMAEINRRIQQATFTQDGLVELIASSVGVPLLGNNIPATTDVDVSA